MHDLTPKAQHVHWRGRVVIVVSPTPTHPQDYGNRKRIFRICKMLQEAGAKIHFLHYASEAEWRQNIPLGAQDAMIREWDGYYLVPPTQELHTPPKGTHHTIDEWWDPQIGSVLGWLAQKIRPDVVIANYTWMSRALNYIPEGTLKVLDTHDKFSNRKEMLAGYGIAPEFFYTTEQEETIALNRADVVWAIKEEECEQFKAMTDRLVVTVPHADPAAPLPSRPLPPEADDFELRIGIMGAKNNINTRNLTRFLEAAGPVFRAHLPPLKIVVGGTICELIEHVDLPFVEKVGWVDDVEDFYRQIDVALVPMEFSTGLKIKTAEAMTYGMPIISHFHAFEGYRPFHAYSSLSSFQEIAEACTDLAFQGPEALEPMRQASVNSHHAVVRALEAGIFATGAAIADAKICTLFSLDPRALRKGTLHEAMALSQLEYLSHRSPVIIYFDTIDDFADLVRFCRLAPFGHVYVNATVQSTLDESTLRQVEEAGVRWLGFEDLLSRIKVRHLWLDYVPTAPLGHFTPDFERIYLNLGAMRRAELSDFLDSDRLDSLIGSFTAVNVLSSRDSAICSQVRQHLGAQMITLAPFWGKSFPLVHAMVPPPPEHRYGVTIILDRASDAIVRMIGDIALLAGEKMMNVVVFDAEESAMRTQRYHGLAIHYLSPDVLDRKTVQMLRAARVTVNFSTGSMFGSTLLAIMESAGLDIRHVGRYEWTSDQVVQRSTLLSFMQKLLAHLTDPAQKTNVEGQLMSQFKYDPGWALIWAQWN